MRKRLCSFATEIERRIRKHTFIPLIRFNNRLRVEWLMESAAGDGEIRTDRDQRSS